MKQKEGGRDQASGKKKSITVGAWWRKWSIRQLRHYYAVVRGDSLVIGSLSFKKQKRTFSPFGVEERTGSLSQWAESWLSVSGEDVVGTFMQMGSINQIRNNKKASKT